MNGLSTSTRNHHMMKVLKVSREAVEEAAEVVKNGGLVIYPTDTVYGLGCNPFDEDAVRRLVEAKKRRGKPLPIAVPSLEVAERVAKFNDAARRIARAFWPGAVTIVLECIAQLPREVTAGTGRVGVRVPGCEWAVLLAELSGGFIVSTSANMSGMEPPRTVWDAINQVGSHVDLALDGGEATLSRPSTVVDLTSGRPVVLREGPVSLEELLEALGG